jgi:hypothetical protein
MGNPIFILQEHATPTFRAARLDALLLQPVAADASAMTTHVSFGPDGWVAGPGGGARKSSAQAFPLLLDFRVLQPLEPVGTHLPIPPIPEAQPSPPGPIRTVSMF